jgi:predicted membrane metal-binding protein
MENKFIKNYLILFLFPFLWFGTVNAQWVENPENPEFTEYDIASVAELISTVVTATSDRSFKRHSVPIINTYRLELKSKKYQLIRCFSYFNAETNYSQRCEFLVQD